MGVIIVNLEWTSQKLMEMRDCWVLGVTGDSGVMTCHIMSGLDVSLLPLTSPFPGEFWHMKYNRKVFSFLHPRLKDLHLMFD